MASQSERLKTALTSRYAIEREIGRGGMATVYLARDLKHEREVAVKVLHPELTAVLGPERFLREIRIAAKLNHPHILPLHDSGQADTFLYYVMPYIAGESLRARLARETQLPIEEAVKIAQQVAAALDYAHRHGIIHRDIKPENILLQEGEAMVSDFGIALAVEAAGGQRITETGLSLGTPEYMSPEQATGERRVDARTDVYSLGCVLYEMIVGQTPYTGPSSQAIIAQVLTERTPSPRALRETVPEVVEQAVMKALAKLPADRFAAAGAFADALGMYKAPVATVVSAAAKAREIPIESRSVRAPAWRRALPWGIAAVAVALAVWTATRPSPAGRAPVARLVVSLPGQQLAGGPAAPTAISADGTRLVYAARSGGATQLYLRPLGEFESQPLPGTENAIAPFFSPDGAWVGFFADSKLKKISVAGGAPLVICDAPWSSSFGFAASWGQDDRIVFAPGLGTGLFLVSASGGSPTELTVPDAEAGETGHGWPQWLPSGEDVLFTVATQEGRYVAILSEETGAWRVIDRQRTQAAGARYLRTGHLLYASAGALLAVPFDPAAREVTQSPVSVVEGVYTFGNGLAYFAVSSSSLLYAPGGAVAAENTLVRVDAQGRPAPLVADRGRFLYPRVSPDGRQVAVAIEEGGNRDIWVYHVASGRRTRITVGGTNTDPLWTPDGRHITFSSNRAGRFDLYRKSADGSGEAELLLAGDRSQFPHSWHPNGRMLAFYELSSESKRDLWLFSLDSTAGASPLIVTAFNERSPTFSPDGRWLAYVSDESGRDEVYVQSYPDGRGRSTVSTEGGKEPVWSGDGRQLYYRNGDRLMVVDVRSGDEFGVGEPALVFEGPYDAVGMASGSVNYDVAFPNQFVMVMQNEESVPTQLNVVLNWSQELTELVPPQ